MDQSRLYRSKLQSMMIRSLFMVCASGLVWADALLACPGLLLGQHLPFQSRDLVTRDHLALFTYSKATHSWTPTPLQVDPLDKEGSLLFPKDPTWTRETLTLSDRLSFPIDRFDDKFEGKLAPAPCEAREFIELSYQGKYAYLATCPASAKAMAPRPVLHDADARIVRTNDYSYRYTAANHLVFENIQVADHSGKSLIPVAKDSDLMIIGDVKNFFSLYFDSSDIDATIVHKRQGPMGLMGGMEFFLRIMAFRIDMQLLPEVNFFEDSLFMPMSMTLPVDAAKYLRRGSGIYYSWSPEADVVWDWNASQLDELDLQQLDPNGKGPLNQPSLKYCNARFCHYTIVGKAKDRPFVMNFKIVRKAADLGFFPQLIRDVPAVEKALDHKLGRFKPEGRIAIYFETARLPKGTHTWDFWIYFPDKNADEKCTFRIKRDNVSQLFARPTP